MKRNPVFIPADKLTENDLIQMIHIEKTLLNKTDSGNIETYLSWYKKNPETFFILKDFEQNQVLGGLIIYAVTDEVIKKLLTGHYDDLNIPISAISSLEDPLALNLYFAKMILDKQFQNMGKIRLLNEAWTLKLISLAKTGKFFNKAYSEIVSEDGRRAVEAFGFKKIGSSKYYEVSLLPPLFKKVCSSTPILFEMYSSYITSAKAS